MTDSDDIMLARLPRQHLSETRPTQGKQFALCHPCCRPYQTLSPEQNSNMNAFKLHSRRHCSTTKPSRQCPPTLFEIEAILCNHMHARSIGGQPNLHVDHEEIDGVKDFSGSERGN